MAEKKYMDWSALVEYDSKIKAKIAADDAATLKAAKDHADGLAGNYEAAGSVASAKSELQGKIDAVQGEVDSLETLVGTLPADSGVASVVAYVDKKTSGIATDAALSELQGKVVQAEADIDAIEADYLKAADKQELAKAVSDEAARADAAEKANAAAIKAIADDYLVEADKTELTEAIATAKEEAIEAILDGVTDDFDTLKEVAAWIQSDTTRAAELTTRVSTAEGEIDTLQSEMDAVEGRMDTAEADIDALQALFGEGDGTVADMIADAVAAEAELRVAGDQAAEASAAAALAAAQEADRKAGVAQGEVDALETVVAGKVAQGDFDALKGRVTTAEGEIDALQADTQGHVVGTMLCCSTDGRMQSNCSLGGVGMMCSLSEQGKQLAIQVSNILGMDVCGIDLLMKDKELEFQL